MFSPIGRSFLDLLFPPTCLHCKHMLPQDHHLLCPSCMEQMPFTEPEEHCKLCYAYLNGDLCHRCLRSPSPFFRCLAPFSDNLSAKALTQGLLHPTGGFLANSLASLMLLQMDRHAFPHGEILISASDSGSKRLTAALSHLLDIPYHDAIKPSSLFHPFPQLKSQTALFLEEKALTFISSGMRGFKMDLQEANVLSEAYPQSINAVIFSRSI